MNIYSSYGNFCFLSFGGHLKILFRWPTIFVILALLIALILVPTITQFRGNKVSHVRASGVPTITLSTATAYPGGKVGITGKGFANQDSISFYLDTTNGSAFQYLGANSSGDVSGAITLPNTAILQGSHTLIAVAAGSGNIAINNSITVVPHVFPVFGKSGTSSQLTGAGFTANEMVQVYWGNTTGQLLGSSTTDASGNLNYTFTAPANLTQSTTYPLVVVRTKQKPSVVRTLFKIIPLTIQTTPGIHNGQMVKIKATGFSPNETVNVSWNANGGQLVASFTSDARGAFSGSFTPPSAPLGSYTITAVGVTSGLQATSSVAIGPGIAAPSGGAPAQSIVVSGGGFSANETLHVYLETLQSTAVSVTTDATGAFSVPYILPSTYNPTLKYHFYAVSLSGSEHAATSFSFDKPYLSTYDNANYGQPITLSGNGFAFNETVNIVWDYQQKGQFTIGTTTGIGFDFTNLVPSTPNQSSVTIAAIGTISHIVATVTVANNAAIAVTPTSGTAGTVVTVTGGNFNSATSLSIFLQGSNTQLKTIQTQSDGSFTTTFNLPTISGAGNLVIEALDTANNISAITQFAYQPVVTLNPTTIHYGESITVVGQHFAANDGVEYYFNGIPSGNVLVDANGAFTTSIVATNNVYTGANTITFCGDSQSICVDASFTVS